MIDRVMAALNWADWLLILVVVTSMAFSIKRGMTREVLSLLSWVAAFVVANAFADKLAALMAGAIKTPSVRLTVAMLLLFSMTLIVGAMLNHVFADILEKTGLTGTDQILGTLFGAVRGMVVVVTLLLFTRSSFSLDPWWQQSSLIPFFMKVGTWSRESIEAMEMFFKHLIAKN